MFPNSPAFSVEGNGLTKREYFAALAMQGIFATYANPEINTQKLDGRKHVEQAVAMADLLIAELNK